MSDPVKTCHVCGDQNAESAFFCEGCGADISRIAAAPAIAEQPSDGVLVILVTHYVTISAIANEGVSSGEGVLLKLNRDAPYEIVGRLDFGRSPF